jgi:hypothetical protein
MAHFAKVQEGIVVRVIVAEQDVIDSGIFGGGWIQTSYNTHGGRHPEGFPLRKNYASVGFSYDSERDAFIPPKPYASWVLDEDTCLWNSPQPYPTDGELYVWDEAVLNWVLPENLTPVTAQVFQTAQEQTVITDVVIDLGSNSADSVMNYADSVSATASDVIIDLSSNGADSLIGGI